MINPDDKIPVDDAQDADTADQRSQQDIHSNGLNEQDESSADESAAPIDLLSQASEASEAAFTLDYDRGIAPKEGDKVKKE